MANDDRSVGEPLDRRSARELTLELQRLRKEASAARLEAQAAAIELLLARIRQGSPDTGPGTPSAADPGERSSAPLPPPRPAGETAAFRDWDEVRRVLVAAGIEEPAESGDAEPVADRQNVADRQIRVDADRPAGRRGRVPKPRSAVTKRPGASGRGDATKVRQRRSAGDARPKKPPNASPIAPPNASPKTLAGSLPGAVAAATITDPSGSPELPGMPEGSHDSQAAQRRRPTAWLVSAAVHLLILVLLAGWTLTVHAPLDQVALAASNATPEESPMETFTIETAEPASDSTEETPIEPEIETSPVGELDWNPSQFDVTAPPAVTGLETSGAVATLLTGGPSAGGEAATAFCGVEGGGQHFVYLVDSSGSMGSAFESARLELIRSVSMLTPDQRFYVVFFDEEPDYMRLSDPQRDEPHSVFATPENKQRLARWAMTIRMDRGRAPYEPLRFALSLRPDVIFMLSDGEFPQRIEEQLRQENRLENLFGDTGPISIIHTIGYHSREGEARMRRIAEENGGQYRYVPKPGSGRRNR